MQNQSNASANNGYSLMPMGAQQFYQMAQQHAMVNGSFAPMVPSYLPLSEPDAYPSMMALGAYNLPQNMVPNQAMLEASMYQQDMNYWNPASFGYNPVPHAQHAPMPSASSSTDATWLDYAPQRVTPIQVPLSPIPAAPVASQATQASVRAGPFPSADADAEHISDAPFADEHKWRKYGQKQVKRSPYPRNYYKCTVSGCPAKKHLEKFWDGSANRERCRTVYIGEHVHPVAASPQVFATTQLDFQNNVLAQSAKIRSMQGTYGLPSEVDQQRLVVECGTQVDENEDGYYWRKYGQKAVKGSTTPRQYYRCRAINCPVKKTVEASPKGNTIVTYDGCHSHEATFHSPQASVQSSSPVSPSLSASYTSRASSPSANAAASYLVRFTPANELVDLPAAAPIPSSAPAHAHMYAQVQAQAMPMTHMIQPVKLEYHGQDFTSAPSYPVADSPSSSFSTTDDDESYLSEPSPKRSLKSEDVSLEDQYHQFAPDAPSPENWYYPATWDANTELITH